MKKLEKIGMFAVAVIFAASVFLGCASKDSGTVSPNTNKANDVEVAVSTRMEIVDWANRAMGSPAQPDWLQSLTVFKNGSKFKSMAGISDERVVKYSSFTGKSEVQALNLAMAEFSWSLASELSSSLEGYLAAGTGTRNQHNMDALRNYAIRVKADIVGAREEARFWQKVNVIDKATGKTDTQYIYYIVYSMDSAVWEAVVRKYMTELIGELVENNVDQTFIAEVGACYSRLVADADKKDQQQAEKELAAARAAQAQAEAEAAKANQATAEAAYAAKKLDAETEAKVQAAQQARELMYASFLK